MKALKIITLLALAVPAALVLATLCAGFGGMVAVYGIGRAVADVLAAP